MTRDEKKAAVCEFLVGNDAALSIMAQMGMPFHAKLIASWGEARAALSLQGWPSRGECQSALESLFSQEGGVS